MAMKKKPFNLIFNEALLIRIDQLSFYLANDFYLYTYKRI